LSVLRKLEVTSGSITVLLATFLSLFVLKFDWDASLTVGYEFAVLRELGLVLLVIFILPGALVAIGAYAHGAKRNAILPMLFATINTWFTLNLLFVLLAILTLLLSFIARKQLNR
jgi:hypothetical protein